METMITGVMSRTALNSLVLTLTEGEAPLAVAKQSGENQLGPRMVVSMGMRNGGKGRHRITMADGSRYALQSSTKKPSELVDAQKGTVLTLESDDVCRVLDAAGVSVITLTPDAATDDLFHLSVRNGSAELGTLEIYRKTPPPATSVTHDLLEIATLVTPTANALKLPLGGVRYVGTTPLAPEQRLALVAASVNLVIGLVPCGAEMAKAFKKLP